MEGDPKRSQWWELEHSWWLALIVVGVGFLTWLAFGYVWLRTKKQRWLAAAILYLVLLVLAGVFIEYPDEAWQSTVGVVAIIACWLGGLVHGLAWRREALDLLSLDEDPRLREARRRLVYRDAASEIVERNPELAHEAGIGRDPESFGGLVDVNSASADQFARLPGFTPEVAQRIVEIREKIGGFDNVDDFARFLSLSPYVVDKIRDRLLCLPR